MNDYAIMIPARDYKLISQAVKKNRYPVEDPGILNRVYIVHQNGNELSAQLVNRSGRFALEYHFYPGGQPQHIHKTDRYLLCIKHDMNHVTFDDDAQTAIAHFDIDPTYD